MDARYTAEEIAAYRAVRPQDDELPDEVVQRLVYFQWFVLSRRLNELGRAVLDSLPFRRSRSSS